MRQQGPEHFRGVFFGAELPGRDHGCERDDFQGRGGIGSGGVPVAIDISHRRNLQRTGCGPLCISIQGHKGVDDGHVSVYVGITEPVEQALCF